jgi:hypothetical protein
MALNNTKNLSTVGDSAKKHFLLYKGTYIYA